MTGDEVTGNGNRDLRIALDGNAAGKGVREIATDLYGVDRVAADWGPDRGLRTRTRRLLRKARENAGRARFGAVAEHDTPGLCARVKGGEKPDQRAEQNTATAAVGGRWSEGVGMRPGAVSAGNEGRA